MVAAGERFAEEDKARREVIETANRGESFVNDTTKSLQEFEAQLDNAEKEKVKGLLEELRELAAKGAAGDASVTSEQIKGAMDAAQTASLGLFQKVYEKRNAESRDQPSEDAEKPEEKEKKD